MGYLGLTPASLTALLIGVLGPTQPGVHILLGPVPCEPIILGLIPGIILGLSSADLTIFCLGPDGTTALGDALPLAGATRGPLPLTTDTGTGDALFLAVVSPAASTLS